MSSSEREREYTCRRQEWVAHQQAGGTGRRRRPVLGVGAAAVAVAVAVIVQSAVDGGEPHDAAHQQIPRAGVTIEGVKTR